MFIIRDWFYGHSKKQSTYDYNDDDDETEELSPIHRRERANNGVDEEEDEDGDWGLRGECDEMDDVFFNDLENAHRFSQGELRSFYNIVREAYLYELPSTATHNTRRDIDQFIHNFLGYLITGYQQDEPSESKGKKMASVVGISEDVVPVRRTYPRLIYMNYSNNNGSAPSLVPHEIDGGAFRVDRRLDFVYAYVIEKGLIDTLRYRGEQISQYQQQDGDYRFIEEILDEIDSYKDIYRMRVNSQYINQDRQGDSTTFDRSSDSWVIYTQRSSTFFKNCIDAVNRASSIEQGIVYSDKTLRIEPIPFQQVLLLCGGYPSFLENHTHELEKEGPITVNIKEADNWVSVPIWFSLLLK